MFDNRRDGYYDLPTQALGKYFKERRSRRLENRLRHRFLRLREMENAIGILTYRFRSYPLPPSHIRRKSERGDERGIQQGFRGEGADTQACAGGELLRRGLAGGPAGYAFEYHASLQSGGFRGNALLYHQPNLVPTVGLGQSRQTLGKHFGACACHELVETFYGPDPGPGHPEIGTLSDPGHLGEPGFPGLGEDGHFQHERNGLRKNLGRHGGDS